MSNTNRQAYLLLTLAALFWAGNTVIGRAYNEEIDPISFAFWRWTLASALLLPFTARHIRADWETIRAAKLPLLLFSLFGVSSFNTLLYYAAKTTTATNIALLQTVMPSFIVLLNWILFRDAPRLYTLIGVSLSMFGAMILVSKGMFDTVLQLRLVSGDFWMLLAVFFYALYSSMLRRRPAIHSWSFVTVTFVFGALALLPLALWQTRLHPVFPHEPHLLASVVYVALCASILSYFAWNRGIELIGSQRAGVFICLIPVFVAFLAFLFLDEHLHVYHLLGAVFVGSGFFLVNRR